MSGKKRSLKADESEIGDLNSDDVLRMLQTEISTKKKYKAALPIIGNVQGFINNVICARDLAYNIFEWELCPGYIPEIATAPDFPICYGKMVQWMWNLAYELKITSWIIIQSIQLALYQWLTRLKIIRPNLECLFEIPVGSLFAIYSDYYYNNLPVLSEPTKYETTSSLYIIMSYYGNNNGKEDGKELDFRGIGYKLTEARIREDTKNFMMSKNLFYLTPISVLISSISSVYFGQYTDMDFVRDDSKFKEIIAFVLTIASLSYEVMLKQDLVTLIAYGFWIAPTFSLMEPRWSEELTLITRVSLSALVYVGRDIKNACLYAQENTIASRTLSYIMDQMAPLSWEYMLSLFMDPLFHPSLSMVSSSDSLVVLYNRTLLPDMDELEFKFNQEDAILIE